MTAAAFEISRSTQQILFNALMTKTQKMDAVGHSRPEKTSPSPIYLVTTIFLYSSLDPFVASLII
jgi:hypothetical protein